MAVKNRKNSSAVNESKNENVIGKTKKQMKIIENEVNSTSFSTNKYGALLGLVILFLGIIYAIIMGNYIYKRHTGKADNALQRNSQFSGNGIDMNNLRNPIPVDKKDDFEFSKEDVERLNEVYVDMNGNAQVPPKNINDEINNENEKDEVKKSTDNDELKQRQKRSVTMESGNSPDETGEMSDYLRNLLTRGPSANFVDLLRNKIVIINSLDNDDSSQPTKLSSTHIRHRRSINQFMYASGSKYRNICYNVNTVETELCY
ncbi:hypothetical protein BCR36DRAFT_581932 [Piromyces finnis]|uniref:Uncharacterized protein n=1 Tax=Piromyces finnis TaxID=1754191 RepID=A0A1Y1VFN4_9FUNG|nr:hypothetical protein BCR36DRAFT_581932 [Piromyces finnis]|eukprot:ORX54303.1 hypothetical protein BCR36DRAFT_581932 [Piromyces finnis]